MLYPNGLSKAPKVTSPFGWRIHPITGRRAFHYGVDSIMHPDGYNHAPEAGTVVFADYNGGNGYEVRIQGDSGRLWKIFHHARLDVKVKTRIQAGARTGLTGTTGNSTGTHCHLECWVEGVAYDAFAVIAASLSGGGGGGFEQEREDDDMPRYIWTDQDGEGFALIDSNYVDGCVVAPRGPIADQFSYVARGGVPEKLDRKTFNAACASATALWRANAVKAPGGVDPSVIAAAVVEKLGPTLATKADLASVRADVLKAIPKTAVLS